MVQCAVSKSFSIRFNLSLIIIKVPQTQTASVCENGVLVVNCGNGYSINVISGYYGRFDTTTCTPCAACQTGCYTTTTPLFSSWFNGHTSVSYQITNGAIGSDPCPGTVKYSQVNFQCVWKDYLLFKSI